MILTKCDIKEINLDLLVESKIQSGKLSEILFIVPTNRKIRFLKRELISTSPNKVAEGINLETIGTFAVILLMGFEGHSRLISDEAAIVLLKQSFQETKLKYFSNYRDEIPFGTLERVKNVISDYKRHSITPELLLKESKKLSGSEKIKAEDISKIYGRYQSKFEDLGAREIGDVYDELLNLNGKKFSKRFLEIFPDVNNIIINGFDEFTIPEIEIINSSANINNVDLYLNFDYYKYNSVVFSHLDSCYNKLKEKGFRVINDISMTEQTRFLDDVKQNLFDIKKKTKTVRFKSQITEITAFNRENEISLIAKEIKMLIADNKIAPNKICVAFNLIKPYSPIIRNQFSVYGIPFNLTDRFSLSTSSPIIAIINLLEIIENDFYYKNIFRALSNNIIEIDDIDINNLLKASIELKVISGYKHWINSINDALIEQQNHDGSINEMRRYHVNYEKALDDIKKLNSLLKQFEMPMTLDTFYKNICELIYNLNIYIKILDGLEDSIEKDVKAVNTFLNSIKELTDLLKIEYGEDKKLPLKLYLNQLITIASFSRYNIKEKSGFGVLVTTLNEIRGLQFDYLFIAGLTDGDFPTRYSPEIFFSGSFVKKEIRHQTEERYHFYQALCSWKRGLYLTHPQTDERKELVESNFLQEFKVVFKLTEKTEEYYDDIIFSRHELLKYVGDSVRNNHTNILLPEEEKKFNLKDAKSAIAINKTRLNEPFANSSFTGVLTNELTDEFKNKLLELKDNQYSITQLESYAKCPFQYFADRVLHLNTLEEPTEELEAFELGSLLHAILFEFYKELKRKDIILQQADDKNFKKAESLLFKTAQDQIDKLKLNSSLTFYEKEKILGIDDNNKNSILYKFLVEERNSTDGFIPEYFELAFGKVDKLTRDESLSSVKFEIGDIKVRGKIDRVDINEKDGTIKIVDYKLSGNRPRQNDLQSGLSLQLPLYLYVAKELIKSQLNKNYEPFGAEIYSLKFSKKDFGSKLAGTGRAKNDKDKMVHLAEEMIKICIESISKYVEEISSGKFNLSRLEDRENRVCKFCNFRSICRIQEVN
jgi:ATP-dependent helicase/nuclease subunit B